VKPVEPLGVLDSFQSHQEFGSDYIQKVERLADSIYRSQRNEITIFKRNGIYAPTLKM
jgi:hypothetical protein